MIEGYKENRGIANENIREGKVIRCILVPAKVIEVLQVQGFVWN